MLIIFDVFLGVAGGMEQSWDPVELSEEEAESRSGSYRGHDLDPAELSEEDAESRSGSYRGQKLDPDNKMAAEKPQWSTTGTALYCML